MLPQFVMAVTSATGLWMALIWLLLYRKLSFIRVLMGPLIYIVVGFLGAFAYLQMWGNIRGNESSLEYVFRINIPGLLFSFLAIVPVVLLRQLTGWRIVDERDYDEQIQTRLPLKAQLLLVTLLSALCAATVIFSGPQTVFRGVALMAIPIIWTFLLYAAMSWVRIRYIWLVAIVFSLIASTPVKDRFFVQAFTLYTSSACLMLFAACYLRSRGILLRFGGKSGFSALRDPSQRVTVPENGVDAQRPDLPISRRAVVLVSGCVFVLSVSVGGWFYYQHWVMMQWQIPASPTAGDLPRLFKIVEFDYTNSQFRRRPNYQNRLQAIEERNQAARTAIIDIGSDAIPFLLEKYRTDPGEGTKSHLISRSHAADLLSMLANEKNSNHTQTRLSMRLSI
ncbi:MAG: hypothetical protein ABGX16_26395 [Pirellulales bacterium]